MGETGRRGMEGGAIIVEENGEECSTFYFVC